MGSAGDSLRRLAIRAERMTQQWPNAAAALVERAVTAELRSATGGDGALSHDKGGGRATVMTRRRGQGAATVEAAGSIGTWAILQRGTRPHTVNARRGKVLRTPYGPRRTVRVSGVRGRRTWTQGVDDGLPQARASARAAFREVIAGG